MKQTRSFKMKKSKQKHILIKSASLCICFVKALIRIPRERKVFLSLLQWTCRWHALSWTDEDFAIFGTCRWWRLELEMMKDMRDSTALSSSSSSKRTLLPKDYLLVILYFLVTSKWLWPSGLKSTGQRQTIMSIVLFVSYIRSWVSWTSFSYINDFLFIV